MQNAPRIAAGREAGPGGIEVTLAFPTMLKRRVPPERLHDKKFAPDPLQKHAASASRNRVPGDFAERACCNQDA